MLKVGFIGLGAISHENVLGYLGNPDTEITAVSCRTEETARNWLKKYNLPKAVWYRDYGDMLDKQEFDIVEILTPHHLHREQAIACSRARVRGISLQKPMANTLNECEEIIAECKRNGVVLKVYDNFIFYPPYLKAKELIAQGLIGELIQIRVTTMTGLRDGAPWPWCFDPGTWRAEVKTCGTGPLVGDDGYHKFSLSRWFMGRDYEKVGAWIDPETPLDAPAFVRAKFKRLPGDCPKYAQIDFTFSPKLALPLSMDFWLEDFIEIVGEQGIMWLNLCSAAGNRELFRGNKMSESPVFPPIAAYVNGEVVTYLDDITPSERNWSTSFVGCTKHFIDVMKNGGEPIYSGEDGMEITRYAMAAFVSAQEGRDVYMDEITAEAQEKREFEIKTNFCSMLHQLDVQETVDQ